ncbi:hypothetical protein D3C83_187300 [compost metagenome]
MDHRARDRPGAIGRKNIVVIGIARIVRMTTNKKGRVRYFQSQTFCDGIDDAGGRFLQVVAANWEK